MPPWWGRSSSKEAKKKSGKDNVVENFNSRKSKVPSEETSGLRGKAGSRRRYLDTTSEKGSVSRAGSRSPSPSNQVSRCQSFADRALSQPLPLPNSHALESHKKPEIVEGRRKTCDYRVHSSLRSLPVPERTPNRPDATDVDGGLGTASISSECSMDSDDPSDAQHSGGCIPISPRAREYSSKAVASSTGRPKNFKNSRESLKPAISLPSSQISSSPSKRRPLSTIEHPPSLQIPHHGAFGSAPDSSMSSPSRSPLRVFPAEQQCGGFWAVKSYLDTAQFGSGHCSSPGSGHNSGHNSMGGDMAGQFFWQHSRGSPECSPIPSPRTTSPGPSSRIHSGAVTPLHPRAGGNGPESPSSWQEEGKHHQCHKLPLPPLTISNVNPFAPSNTSANASSPVPRSPGKPENPPSPGSRWKKGKLLGQGTFGHVYVGFSNESGDMCAMKEVTLFADDAKSKESAKQLAQEIAVLSRLRHPNIVQYYGSETVDDKLYIYLEYVSGGSIHKLLQEYGYFSDPVIRSYTQQILSGLAYLHAKNTVHRDIKGANILVDPNGRVKLADFGMAKHITGHSLPLSFKGSPYWMAPEVIRNSNGCNLAVDIWSLGCTVLEMATTKPPWSQYEGVAALFKIGNSKELPAIPDSLSDEGKDFVRVCLQRNPANRPTAAQLLEHPFVKNAAPLIRPDIRNDMSDLVNDVASTTEQMSGGHTRHLSTLDMEAAAMKQHGGVKSFHASGDGNIPRNLSLPVSPSASPLCHSRSPPNLSGRLSPPSISSPITMSGSSTPLTGGNGALPYHAMKQMSVYYNDNYGLPRSPPGLYPNPASSIAYSESKPDMFLGMQPDRVPVIRERMENNFLVTSSGRPVHRENNLQYRGQVALAEHVSQLLRSPNKSPPDVRRSVSPLPGRGGGA